MTRCWQDWINYFLGLWVFGSPWFIEHTMIGTQPGAGSRGMINLWVVGLAVVLLTPLAINGIVNRPGRCRQSWRLARDCCSRPGSSVSAARRH